MNENTSRAASAELSAFGGQARRGAKRSLFVKEAYGFFDKLEGLTSAKTDVRPFSVGSKAGLIL